VSPDECLTAVLALAPGAPLAAVLTVVDAILTMPGVESASRMVALADVVWRVFPGLLGVSLYRSAPPGARLVLAANQGIPAALDVRWGNGIIGITAEERVVEIIPSVRAFRGYRLINPSIVAALAVPITLRRIVLGVWGLWAAVPEAVGPLEAEILQAVADRMAHRWPGTAQDPHAMQ
jgi:putative methionine-R-sulfoxide reductase with GAF domain